MDIVIVDHDTLRAIGLRHLLREWHGLEAVIADDPRTVDGVSDTTFFFVTTDAFAALPYFYVPRRQNVVLISHRTPMSLPVITPGASEQALRQQLADNVKHLGAVKPATSLSARERDVLRLIAKGLINKEIAQVLNISFNTVLTHRKNITNKLGIKTAAALSVYAMMNGLVDEDNSAR